LLRKEFAAVRPVKLSSLWSVCVAVEKVPDDRRNKLLHRLRQRVPSLMEVTLDDSADGDIVLMLESWTSAQVARGMAKSLIADVALQLHRDIRENFAKCKEENLGLRWPIFPHDCEAPALVAPSLTKFLSVLVTGRRDAGDSNISADDAHHVDSASQDITRFTTQGEQVLPWRASTS
jgi:hypothetical protein